MEHKLDDFLRKKLETAETKLPTETGFDEDLLWGELQKNLHRTPRRQSRKWLLAAACLIGLVAGAIALSEIGRPTRQTFVTIPKSSKTSSIMNNPPVAINSETITAIPIKKQKSLTKEVIEIKADALPEIKELAIRPSQPEIIVSPVLKDSVVIKPPVMATAKPRFKVIHVNEITDPEKESVPQPRFKIRFAARNPH